MRKPELYAGCRYGSQSVSLVSRRIEKDGTQVRADGSTDLLSNKYKAIGKQFKEMTRILTSTVPSSFGQCVSWHIRSVCSKYNMKSITEYMEEVRYLTEQVPFSCKHGRDLTGLKPTDGKENGEMAVPRPRMAQLGLAERIARRRSMNMSPMVTCQSEK